MKRTLAFSLFLALLAMPIQEISAQRGRMQSRQDLINAEKIAFFTERMALTAEEAKVFWPVYNDFLSQREKLFVERRRLGNHFMTNRQSLNDKETSQLLDKYIDLQLQEAKLAESFHRRFQEVLAADKVMIFYLSEAEFRNYLLRRLSGGGRGPGGSGGGGNLP